LRADGEARNQGLEISRKPSELAESVKPGKSISVIIGKDDRNLRALQEGAWAAGRT